MKDKLYELKGNKNFDNRGYFLNLFRHNDNLYSEFWDDRNIEQINLSESLRVGTIRGMHFQKSPYLDAKIIRCLEGKIWDVAVDLRKGSNDYKKWHAIELDAKKANAFFIPEGFAHGFQVLEPNTKVLYIHSSKWIKSHESGIRWNDKILNISWPLKVSEMSERDENLPFLEENEINL